MYYTCFNKICNVFDVQTHLPYSIVNFGFTNVHELLCFEEKAYIYTITNLLSIFYLFIYLSHFDRSKLYLWRISSAQFTWNADWSFIDPKKWIRADIQVHYSNLHADTTVNWFTDSIYHSWLCLHAGYSAVTNRNIKRSVYYQYG